MALFRTPRAVACAFGITVLSAISATAADESLSVGLAVLPPGKGNPHGEMIDYLGTWSALFDPLTLTGNDGELIPRLAVSWEQIDPFAWDFVLRDDVVFSNGAPFDADAVVAAVRYITSDRGRSERIVQSLPNLRRAEALAPYRVRLVTNEPSPMLPYEIQLLRIPEPGQWQDLGPDGFAQEPVGTGPYVVDQWSAGSIVLRSNSSSWRAPRIKELKIYGVSDEIARFNGFLTGQFDIFVGVDPDSFEEIEAAGGRIHRNVIPAAFAIVFHNVKDPRFSSVPLRQALNYAVNKKLIIDVFFKGMTVPASQPTSIGTVGFNDAVVPYPYDPDKAKILLAEAGYGDGFSFTLIISNESSLSRSIYQQVAMDFSRVGVDMDIVTIPRPQFLRHFQDDEWEGSAFPAGYFSASSDALRNMRGNSCLRPVPWYCDPYIVPTIEEAWAQTEMASRIAMTKELMAYGHDTAQGLFLYEGATFTALGGEVNGYDSFGMYVLYENVSKD